MTGEVGGRRLAERLGGDEAEVVGRAVILGEGAGRGAREHAHREVEPRGADCAVPPRGRNRSPRAGRPVAEGARGRAVDERAPRRLRLYVNGPGSPTHITASPAMIRMPVGRRPGAEARHRERAG